MLFLRILGQILQQLSLLKQLHNLLTIAFELWQIQTPTLKLKYVCPFLWHIFEFFNCLNFMSTLHEKIYSLDNFKTTKILNYACTKRHFLRVIKMAWANPGPHGPRLKKAYSAKKAHSAKKIHKVIGLGLVNGP